MVRFALLAAAVALVAAVAPALAAQDHTITASDYVFTEANITIASGDRVYFANSGGVHNFVFEDGLRYPASAMPPGPAWNNLYRDFPAAGTYPYYCVTHGGPGGLGMSGTITVAAPPQPSPSPTPGPGGGGGGTMPAGVRSLSLAPGRFCARRGPKCRRPGVRLRIDLATPARVTGVLKRRAKRFGYVRFGTVAAGPRTLRFQRTSSGKRLKVGRYSLALRVDSAAVKTLRFRVR